MTDTTITLQGQTLAVADGETVLDALIGAGMEVSFGCRSGVCRSCTMVVLEGTPPEAARKGLSEAERRQGLFLPCLCRPTTSMTIAGVDDRLEIAGSIAEIRPLSERVALVRVVLERPLEYVPGQFVSLVRADGLARSYSIASQPTDGELEFHIGQIQGGRMTSWIHSEAQPGTSVRVRGPFGSCCYEPGEPDAPLMLLGVGTGLAPLWGIVIDALNHGHRGPIVVGHGARARAGLYLHDELAQLAEKHTNLAYRPVVLEGEPPQGGERGSLPELALTWLQAAPIASWWSFLCGDPSFVEPLRKSLFMAGCGFRRIRSDAFVLARPK